MALIPHDVSFSGPLNVWSLTLTPYLCL